jgi:hypothetical protein
MSEEPRPPGHVSRGQDHETKMPAKNAKQQTELSRVSPSCRGKVSNHTG